MNNEMVLFLLKGGHLDMNERIEKKIWPHPPLKLSTLIKIITEYLKSHPVFPYEWIERKNGELNLFRF